MATNVIREDVVQLDFQIEGLKELQKMQDEINALKKLLTGGVGEDALDEVKKGADESVKPLKKVKEQAEKVTKSVSDIGKKAATVAFNGLKKLAGISFKALSATVAGVATAIGGLVMKSVSAYAEFEQLEGGVQTLFKDSAGTVMKNANDAFKTAGLSANEYMDTVTSFSASLISSVGGDTAKAAELAQIAIVDMSDNANKMGTDMGSIQYAYQGFAKQNYTMLDNLKLGYGGTKTEMERLIKDAAKLDSSIDANSMSYANIVKAIHAVQENMDIMGTTQKEAEGTITGSLNMMKSAWGNLLPALIQGGDTFEQCFENLIYSVDKFSDNVMPAIETALQGAGTLIEKLVPKFAEKFPEYAEKLIPPLINAAWDLTQGLIKAFPTIIKTVFDTIVDICGKQFPTLKEIFGKIADFFANNGEKIVNAIKIIIPVVLGLVAAFKLFKGVKAISSLFGGLGKGGGSKNGGIFDTFKNLAKMKTTEVLKGMANLAIILGGITLLAAAFMAIAPYMSKLTDLKSVFKVILVVGALGLLAAGLAKLSEIVGKISVKTVALGLANMAIMLVGMTALTAAFMLVSPSISELSNSKAVFKVMGIMLALGALGTVLSIFAGIAGLIPIAMVLKGLANMALVLIGMTALTAAFMLVAPEIAALSSGGAVFKVMGIMLVLGTLGTILTVFAGICGVIPIPVVLAGLANIGLVIGGLTALVSAFAALSMITGFNDFLEKGGETLSQLFGIIGNVAGSLVGGFGEAVSNSLPKIGENIGKFGENIQPLFDAMSKVNIGDVAVFFGALVGLLAIATGKDIVDGIKAFFGDDESALEKLGTDLTNFGNNAKGFFNTVATLPENGFKNASLMFQSLADVSNVPASGGVFQWFTGTADFTSLANGLKQLSGDGVIGFYNTVTNLPAASFERAKAFFQSLSDIGSIPNSGGVFQWFTGTADYSGIATGLKQLSDEGVKGFFAMVANLPLAAFENTKLLFKSLSEIGSLQNTGGVFQWFTGSADLDGLAEKLPPFGEAVGKFYSSISGIEDFSRITKLFKALGGISENLDNTGGVAQWFTGEKDISKLGEQLEKFGESTKDFFTQVNSLDINKLNSLWESLKKPKELSSDITETVEITVDGIVDIVSELPKKMGDSIRNSGSSLKQAIADIWKEAVIAAASPVNKLIEGANWILTEFGADKTIAKWTPYAKGTNGHKGGNALVNDGAGAEMVQMPNGKTFIPNGKNVFIPNAPRGMKVLTAEQTAQLMGKRSPTFNYADGTGDIDIYSYMDNAAGLIDKVKDKYVNYDGVKAIAKDFGKSLVEKVSKQMVSWTEKLFDEFGALSLEAYNPSSGVEQWRSTVIKALKMEGQYSEANVARTLYQMQTESGGNPRAINLWDSNAKKGIPSKGLMQCIDPTFNAYARAGFNKNIYDPLSNILASIRYAVSRYGSLANAYQGHGYANGGIAYKPSIFGEDGAEMAIPLSNDKRKRGISLWAKTGKMLGVTARTPQSTATQKPSHVEYNTYAPEFNLTISGSDNDRTLERKVKKWISEAMNEMLESAARRNPRIRET